MITPSASRGSVPDNAYFLLQIHLGQHDLAKKMPFIITDCTIIVVACKVSRAFVHGTRGTFRTGTTLNLYESDVMCVFGRPAHKKASIFHLS